MQGFLRTEGNWLLAQPWLCRKAGEVWEEQTSTGFTQQTPVQTEKFRERVWLSSLQALAQAAVDMGYHPQHCTFDGGVIIHLRSCMVHILKVVHLSQRLLSPTGPFAQAVRSTNTLPEKWCVPHHGWAQPVSQECLCLATEMLLLTAGGSLCTRDYSSQPWVALTGDKSTGCPLGLAVGLPGFSFYQCKVR